VTFSKSFVTAQANRTTGALAILLIIGIAYTIADTAIYLVSDTRRGEPLPTVADIVTKSRPVAIQEILAANLFGRAPENAAPAPDADLQAPDSNLDLTLLGVFQAKDPQRSTAIVAEKNRPGQLYAVGAAVSGNVMLARVSDDHIVLRRAASFETLRFPQLKSSAAMLPDDSSALSAATAAVESADASSEPQSNDYGDTLPPPLPSTGQPADEETTNNG
jgi:type II secretory pathway component PulC